MNATKRNFGLFSIASLTVLGGSALVHAENFSNPSVNNYWAEAFTDSSGTYNSPDQNTTVSGGMLSAPIPTDGDPSLPDYDVVNYVRVYGDSLPGAATYYNGTLLGDLSGASQVTATFNVTNSALSLGSPFQSSQFVGEGTVDSHTTYSFGGDSGEEIYTGTPTPSVRIFFLGSAAETANGDGSPNEWWADASAADLTSMNNGQDVTLTVSFDPSDWSNYDGHVGDASPAFTTDFDNALSSVERIGLSFGSGDFYSDGWSFDTAGTANLNLESFNTTVPEPASFSVLGLGALALLRRRRRVIKT
jgi:PEP-CTERM motif